MTFDWSEYLNVAKELAGIATTTPEQEAKLRAAISRAYYAVFILARNHLRDREGHSIPTTGDAHQYVASQFKQSQDSNRRFVGDKLKRLRMYRNQADYVDFFPGLTSLTPRVIEISEQVILHLNNL
ncbi:hypothetical protein BCD67_07700 [Oscillatoriales cyanobacterium USR001]|nr:hypothetical protein BCD67_07700 [Oscillatoriales cyanobacterium USR001]